MVATDLDGLRATPFSQNLGIDSPVIGIQAAGTEYISPVFGIPPQIAIGWDHSHTTHTT